MNDKIAAIQTVLGVTIDGIWGEKSQAALDSVINGIEDTGWHDVIASSFADPADIRAFKRCKDNGGSDQQCFKIGDNGIGLWGDSCAEGTGNSCALPPEDWSPFFHTARNKGVIVKRGTTEIQCQLKDTMPHKANIKNGAGIDLNPDSVKALGMVPPIMEKVSWKWA